MSCIDKVAVKFYLTATLFLICYFYKANHHLYVCIFSPFMFDIQCDKLHNVYNKRFYGSRKSCSDINPERGYSMVLQVFFL